MCSLIIKKSSNFTKDRRGKNKGFSYKGNSLSFGFYGLKSLSWGFLNFNQIESGRKVISKYIKKEGKLWIKILPNISRTKKPLDSRMGNGKGDIVNYVFKIKPGRIIYEISEKVQYILAFKSLKLASFKLPLKTVFINKNE